MFVYIDFEATQYTNEIISIGAVKSTGETFYSLVKPKSLKCVTSFITNLTGITKDMLKTAPDPVKVFQKFSKWAQKDGQKVTFLVYGGFDKTLVQNCVNRYPGEPAFKYVNKRLNDIERLANIIAMQDKKDTLRLVELYEKLTGNEPENAHNALGDAYMLKGIHESLLATPDEKLKSIAEREMLRRYKKQYRSNRMRKRPLRDYLDMFDLDEIRGMTINDFMAADKGVSKAIEHELEQYMRLMAI